MGNPIVIVGAGGFGREVVMLIRDINRASPGTWDLLGFVDDGEPNLDLCQAIGVTYLGSRAEAATHVPPGVSFVVAVGAGHVRRELSEDLISRGWQPATLVHPSVWIGDAVSVGAGSVICAGNILTTNVTFGVGAQINLACTVGHDVVAGDFVTLSPAVSLSGGVTIGDLATIYTRAAVNPLVSIGAESVVGAGAVVAKGVASGVTVVGVPARPISGAQR